MKLSDARLGHQRPALIQESEWRPRSPYHADAKRADPVREGLLRFYNGELFQIITTYDRQRVEGMTEADMVEAISLAYGTSTKPAVSEYSYDLIRTGDQASFALILSLKRLDVLAQAAIVEAGSIGCARSSTERQRLPKEAGSGKTASRLTRPAPRTCPTFVREHSMILAGQSLSLSVGTFLIAPGTPLPPAWRLEGDSVARGWLRLANAFDRHEFEDELVAAGWTFFFMAGAITTTAFGLSEPRRLDTALARIIAAVRLQRCNCLEIDDIGMRSFLGVPYVSISAHSRHIQKGMVFSGQ